MKPNDETMQRAASENGFRRDYASMEPFSACSQIKVITLRRRGNNMPLGFSIRGGWEHGTGIFVSEVQPGSIAQRQGLRVGDQIVRINGFSIHRAIHMEVLSLLKTCPGVVLKVRRVGILPVKERRKDPVTWKFVDSASILSHPATEIHNGRIHEYIPENCVIVKIEFSVPGSSSLGCSIAKGPPEMPGIFMCTVKEGGLAADAGLEVGDQIMDMNGSSFLDIKLADAVALLKSVKDIKLTVKKAAGVCLFTEQKNATHMNGHEPSSSNGTSSRCGTSTSPKRRPTPALKEHDFSSGSTSSKSEDSSFQSSDSEKDYSISEESGIHSMKPTQQNGYQCHHSNGRQHKKSGSLVSTATESGGSSSSSDEVTRIDDRWLAEERKKLEEEQRKLVLEKQRLEEEKRRLKQLERSSGHSSSEESSSFPATRTLPSGTGGGGFLEELQKVAAKMSVKDDRGSIDDMLMERRNGETGTLKKGNGCHIKGDEDLVKRRQHEMLMEEFRLAHRKMFGQLNGQLNGNAADDKSDGKNDTLKKVPSPSTKTSPPPPVPFPKASSKAKITVNGQTPSTHSQTLPRPERALSLQPVKTSVDDMAGSPTKQITPGSVNFKVTFDTKRPNSNSPHLGILSEKKADESKGTLVQVKPWTTRL